MCCEPIFGQDLLRCADPWGHIEHGPRIQGVDPVHPLLVGESIFEGKLIHLAVEELEALVASEEADVVLAVLAVSPERSEFEREIERQVQKVRVPEKRIGRRFSEAKVQVGEGTLRQVRSIGTSSLLMGGLSVEQRRLGTHGWQRDWSRAIVPWGDVGSPQAMALWRSGLLSGRFRLGRPFH